MGAAELAAELREAGLTVKEFDGWETRGISWAEGAPVGIMEHHTAPPVPFPLEKLAGLGDGNIRCNINTKTDGTVWLIAFDACNFSSGPGLPQVLGEARAGTPPTASAKDRGFEAGNGTVGSGDDDISGNTFFWNFENDHLGDGSAMPEVQHDAIVLASVVVANHFGLSWKNVVGHSEFTARKFDPNWNGDRRCIETIRNHMEIMSMFTEAEVANLKELAALPSANLTALAALPSARLSKLAALSSAEIGQLVKLAVLPSADIGQLVKLAALPSAEIGRLVKVAGDFSVKELNRLNSLVAFMIAEGLTGEETGRPALWYDALRNELGVPRASPDVLAQEVAAHIAGPDRRGRRGERERTGRVTRGVTRQPPTTL